MVAAWGNVNFHTSQQNTLTLHSYVTFIIEIVFYLNTKHFINHCKMSSKRLRFSQEILTFMSSGKLISYDPCIFASHLCPLSPPLQEIVLFISPMAFQYLVYIRNCFHYFMILSFIYLRISLLYFGNPLLYNILLYSNDDVTIP